MGRQRVLLVNCIIVFIISASIFDIVTDREHWPFSPYAMYSNIQGRNFKWIRLFGVTQQGEIPLAGIQFLSSFDEPRLVTAFRRMKKRPNNHQLLNKALHYYRDRYEALRLSRTHTGPPLQGVRFYDITLDLDAWVQNRNQPTSMRLLDQIMLPDQKD